MALYNKIHNGILLHYPFPVGQAGSYALTLDDALIADENIVQHGVGDNNLTLDADGYLSGSLDWSTFFAITPPAKTTTIRKYSMWGTSAATAVNETGIRFIFNWSDGSNWYETRYHWNGSAWRNYMGRVMAGSFSFVSSPTGQNLNGAVDDPINWLFELYDAGDYVWVNHSAHEIGNNNVLAADSEDITEYAVDRFNKNALRFHLTWGGGPDQLFPRGIRIEDI